MDQFRKDSIENPAEFKAFAKAWYKLTHRDMGPVSRCLGPDAFRNHNCGKILCLRSTIKLIEEQDIVVLKSKILSSGLTISQLVSTAWASASTFRGSDKRGGANGARIQLAPQKDWEVNNPAQLTKVLAILSKIQQDFNKSQTGGKKVSMADLIVLGGCAAIEVAAKKAGSDVSVPFTPGRTDATQDKTDVASFAVLEPKTDGFRNFFGKEQDRPAEELVVDRAQLADADSSRDDSSYRRTTSSKHQHDVPTAWHPHQSPRNTNQ